MLKHWDAKLLAALARGLGRWASELNGVFGREVVPPPSGYEPPAAARRAQVCAELVVCLLREAARYQHVLVVLHLQTGTSSEYNMQQASWKVASALAHAASLFVEDLTARQGLRLVRVLVGRWCSPAQRAFCIALRQRSKRYRSRTGGAAGLFPLGSRHKAAVRA